MTRQLQQLQQTKTKESKAKVGVPTALGAMRWRQRSSQTFSNTSSWLLALGFVPARLVVIAPRLLGPLPF